MRDQHILENLQLVRIIALRVRKTLPIHVDLDDLCGAGMIGLIQAAEHYDSLKKIPFDHYARFRIRGAILDYLRGIDWASRDARQQAKRFQRMIFDLTTKLGRWPTEQEMAIEAGLSLEGLYKITAQVAAIEHPVDLDALRHEDGNPIQEFLKDQRQGPHEYLERKELRSALEKAISKLPPRYAQVIRLYFFEDRTMKEVGDQMGVNESRISQMVRVSLERMRVAMAA